MFSKSKQIPDNDKQLMIAAMDKIISGDFSLIDVSEFSDQKYAEKLNGVLHAFHKANNNFVMRLNESMEVIGDCSIVKKMLDQVELQDESLQEMNSASSELQDSIKNISNELGHIESTVTNAINVSHQSISDMQSTINFVETSVAEISGITDKVQNFRSNIDEITTIVDMVKKLAKQSGMLALNASIEAARAGEAGKGFAVVANQVTEFSKNTSSCADEIVRYVGMLCENVDDVIRTVENSSSYLGSGHDKLKSSMDDFNEMNNQMSLLNESVNKIVGSMDVQTEVTSSFVQSVAQIADSYNTLKQDCVATGVQFYKIGRHIDTARSDMARGFSKLTLQDWLCVFKIDHLILTWRLYTNLAHFEHLKITQLNNPKGCKIGKWAASVEDKRIKESQQFREVMRFHEELHKYACDCWYAAENDNTSLALEHFEKALDRYNKYSAAIDELKKFVATIGYTESTEIIVYSP